MANQLLSELILGCSSEQFSEAPCHKWAPLSETQSLNFKYEKFKCQDCALICVEIWKGEQLVAIEYDDRNVIYNQLKTKETKP